MVTVGLNPFDGFAAGLPLAFAIVNRLCYKEEGYFFCHKCKKNSRYISSLERFTLY